MRLVGHGIDAAYAALPGTYAYFPILATQSAPAPHDHPPLSGRRVKRPKHLVMRPGIREGPAVGADAAQPIRGGGAFAPPPPCFYVLDRSVGRRGSRRPRWRKRAQRGRR